MWGILLLIYDFMHVHAATCLAFVCNSAFVVTYGLNPFMRLVQAPKRREVVSRLPE